MDDPCYTFRYAACSAYVTHLYFHNMKPSAMSGPIRSDSQVSAVIQLQFNRFSSLKRIYERWEGPIHVVLYLNQTESQLVQAELKKDTKLRRENICYHVVYKQFVSIAYSMPLTLCQATNISLTDPKSQNHLPGSLVMQH